MRKLFLICALLLSTIGTKAQGTNVAGGAAGAGSGTNLASPGPLCATTPCSVNATTVTATGPTTVTSDGIHAGYTNWVGNTANQAVTPNTIGFMGPTAVSFTGYALQFPIIGPTTALPILSCPTPVSSVSACSFVAAGAAGANTALSNIASVAMPNGTVAAPTLAFAGQTAATGWYLRTGGFWSWGASSNDIVEIGLPVGATGIQLGESIQYCISSGTLESVAADACLGRSSAGVLEVSTSPVTPNALGSLALANVTATGTLTDSVATGTAPLAITSTTPVANLTVSNHPKVQFCGATSTCSATAEVSDQIVYGSAPLVSGTPSTVTITGISPAFASTTSYRCTATDDTTAANNLIKFAAVSGSSFTITGPATTTDVVGYVCVGH